MVDCEHKSIHRDRWISRRNLHPRPVLYHVEIKTADAEDVSLLIPKSRQPKSISTASLACRQDCLHSASIPEEAAI
jgi:hypothetical protein